MLLNVTTPITASQLMERVIGILDRAVQGTQIFLSGDSALETAAAAKQKPSDAVAIVSYDEKPGIQAIATTAPDRPPAPGGE